MKKEKNFQIEIINTQKREKKVLRQGISSINFIIFASFQQEIVGTSSE